MKTHELGIIMNGVTGRMGTNQHLLRSVAAIVKQGGVKLSDHEVIMPRPILVGRNENKLRQAAALSGIDPPVTTELAPLLADSAYSVYFDSQTTDRRATAVKQAIAAGKHIYCEKPTALTTEAAMELYARAEEAGVKHGVVQDKLWLPGIVKLKQLVETGFF
ncbi:MAG: Gfo/Idh/MocA family oxidoreductase, partial [Phycisphaeraceae bacterium]